MSEWERSAFFFKTDDFGTGLFYNTNKDGQRVAQAVPSGIEGGSTTFMRVEAICENIDVDP